MANATRDVAAHDAAPDPLAARRRPSVARKSLERRHAGKKLGNKRQLNFPYVLFPFADQIVRAPALLDMVEALIGPDILVWSGAVFIKEPKGSRFVS